MHGSFWGAESVLLALPGTCGSAWICSSADSFSSPCDICFLILNNRHFFFFRRINKVMSLKLWWWQVSSAVWPGPVRSLDKQLMWFCESRVAENVQLQKMWELHILLSISFSSFAKVSWFCKLFLLKLISASMLKTTCVVWIHNPPKTLTERSSCVCHLL